MLFNQHSAHFTPEGNVLCFNNGRSPDRHWSTVDEIALPHDPMARGGFIKLTGAYGPEKAMWSHGPRQGRQGSFYCTHISGCQRLENGNTLVTMGPQGIVFEVTPENEEVWRWVSPLATGDPPGGEQGGGGGTVHSQGGLMQVTSQRGERMDGRFSLFRVMRYPRGYGILATTPLVPKGRIEEGQ